MSVHPAMFSSATDEWATPAELIAKLPFRFELDVCATPENAKAPRFFTRADDGLTQEWRGVCWMNPPYGRKVTGRWVAKAAASALEGATVVCLLPARTDTRWFQDFVYPVLRARPNDVRFLRGRLKFGGAKHGAPFPSVLVVFRPVPP
jgi:phage N-6-adenine-methyltransferase